MSSHPLRLALALVSLLALVSPVHGQTPAPAAVESQDSADAKLAVVLRSYTLLQAENDQLKAAQEKLLADKSALEAQLAVAKNALPLAEQAAGYHEQLRQTQDQLAALSLENNALKTKLSFGPGPTAGTPSTLTPTPVTRPPPPPPPPRPGRAHGAHPRHRRRRHPLPDFREILRHTRPLDGHPRRQPRRAAR